MAYKKIYLVGQRFGKLVVVEESNKFKGGKYPARAWKCKCDCGNEKIIRQDNLLKKATKSCGCLSLEILHKNQSKERNGLCKICNKPYKYYHTRDFTCSEECYKIYHKQINKKRRDNLPKTFNERLKRILERIKSINKKTDITIEFLKELLINQNNCCSVSNIPFELSYKELSPWSLSIDRIDSAKCYTKDNIRLVCLMYNLAKNIWTDNDVIKLAKMLPSSNG